MHWTLLGQMTLVSLLFGSTYAARTCYNPNGKIATKDQPCFPQNPESACCGGSTYVCASNNMCAYYDASYYVIGSCTDKTWNSPACPSYCFFRDHVHNTVFRCSADTYCCKDGPSCNCTTGVNTQKILDFLPDYSDLVGSSVALDTVIATSSLLTPIGATRDPGTTTSTTVSSTSESTTISEPTTTSEATETATAISTQSSASAESDSETAAAEQHGGSNNELKIGLGVGIPLGAIAIILAVLLLLMRRRWKKNRDQNLTETMSSSQPMFQHRNPQRPSELEQNSYAPSRQTDIYEAPGNEVYMKDSSAGTSAGSAPSESANMMQAPSNYSTATAIHGPHPPSTSATTRI